MHTRRRSAAAMVGALLALAGPRLVLAFTPETWSTTIEAQNFSKTQERQTSYDQPAWQAQLALVGAQNRAAATQEQTMDSGREFSTDVCYTGENGCAGDAMLYSWQSSGYGIVQPVYFTARSGATISGHVWATRSGPAQRPGVVITNGSVQADEQMYWYAAQALAKAGYVVLTWDPQGQGQSDTQGETPDQNEGFPAQSDGRPFFDGTEDAIDFFLSTPSKPYVPVVSCSSGTSHAPKQASRVTSGLDNAYNPFSAILDPARIGIAGHSYGAAGVSYIGQWDPRVSAIVAWDNLAGTDPATTTGASGGGPSEQPCPSTPADRTVAPITKPALGMSADYFLPPTPNTAQPDPTAKSTESAAYTKARVDTGEIIIHGGSHLDFSYIPNQGFGASLRGADMIAWYTTAWFDKYVKHDASADVRLLTTRWQDDPTAAGIDPHGDGNLFSFFYPSRLDVRLAGRGTYDCEDLRDGCPGMVDSDGQAGSWSYLGVATTPDTGSVPPNAPKGTGLYPSYVVEPPLGSSSSASAGATASAPPAASSGSGATTFAYDGTTQTYTVPAGVTSVVIAAVGAAGGGAAAATSTSGGHGASVQGTFAVTPGQQLTVLVGGVGGPGTTNGGGGGGGSFVWTGTGGSSQLTFPANLLVAAGGGGGGSSAACGVNGLDASTSTAGSHGANPNDGSGGTAGSGGKGGGEAGNAQLSAGGAGGGATGNGLNGDGTTGLGGAGGNGGSGASAGGVGQASEGFAKGGGQGGFGGGAGSGSDGGGGGGGYSGGGGGGGGDANASGADCGPGGGGGSFNGGTAQVNATKATTTDGNGVVTIAAAAPAAAVPDAFAAALLPLAGAAGVTALVTRRRWSRRRNAPS